MSRDNAAISLLSGQDTLRDSTLRELQVFHEEGRVNVLLKFDARTDSRFSHVVLSFFEVSEFSFAYDGVNVSLDIWDLKLLKCPDGRFYISLDPDPATLPAAGIENTMCSEADNFAIYSAHIEARGVLR